MKKNTQYHKYNSRKINLPGFASQILATGAGVLMRVLKSGDKRNKSRKPYAVSSCQNIWQLKRLSQSLMVCFAVAAVIACTGWFSFLLLKNSDIFLVTSVDVQGNRIVSKQQVLASAELNRGINLLEMDIEQVESGIRSHAWIESVMVKRRWPSSVEIVVREHKPLALFNFEENGRSKLYYIDAGGCVFAPLTVVKDLDFPVLTGKLLAENLHEMQVRKGSPADQGLQVMKLAAKGNQTLPLQAISEVHVNKDKGVILYLVDHPFPIYMGKEKIRNRFNLLVRVLAQLYRQDKVKEVAEIRMDYAEDRIMVAELGAS